jgi:NAD(P)-dependent dehydrogenase (short-subunit alcohol dehydrogenase family)
MFPDLKDQVVIVTGGYRGLGRALSLSLAEMGARVAVAARSLEKCAQLVEQITAAGGTAMAIRLDVSDPVSVKQLVKRTLETWGTVDLLVNNAGIQGKIDWVVNYDPVEWDRIMSVLLKGPFLCAQAVLPEMIRKRRGKIVNVAAGVGEERVDYGVAAYYAAKAGLINFTRQCAAEVKQYGVFVNAIDPGGMDTAMSDEGIAVERASAEFVAQTNAGRGPRLRAPEAIVPMVLFLLSKASDMMTGRLLQASSPDDVQYLQL